MSFGSRRTPTALSPLHSPVVASFVKSRMQNVFHGQWKTCTLSKGISSEVVWAVGTKVYSFYVYNKIAERQCVCVCVCSLSNTAARTMSLLSKQIFFSRTKDADRLKICRQTCLPTNICEIHLCWFMYILGFDR